jgi:hypothetical protein
MICSIQLHGNLSQDGLEFQSLSCKTSSLSEFLLIIED